LHPQSSHLQSLKSFYKLLIKKRKMINIKIHKKDLWLLSAIVVFLVGVGYVVAWGSGNPNVHGHDTGEIGLPACATGEAVIKTSSGWGCGSSGTGTSCTTILTTNPAGKLSWTSIDVPTNCRNRPCKLVLMVSSATKVTNIMFGDYYQVEDETATTTERWETSGNMGSRSGNNGDSSETNIFDTDNLQIKDDKSGTETDRIKWTYRDDSNTYGMTLQICNY